MFIFRWTVGLFALTLYVALVGTLVALAIRRVKTGQYASGLSFIPTLLASIGILILPTATLGTRAPFILIPFAIESLYFCFNVAYDALTRDVVE
ncbi:hypothetical protein N9Y42_09010 [Mariniblastus sp.]|nr:hypothetical protein [Mariniblastus sp.]